MTRGKKVTVVPVEEPTVLDFGNLPLVYKGATPKNIECIIDTIDDNDIVECSPDTNPGALQEIVGKKYPGLKVKIIPFSQY